MGATLPHGEDVLADGTGVKIERSDQAWVII
jgi:hypothetical protein